MEDYFLTYRGFHPSNYTRAVLQNRMKELLEEAPYGATLSATFAREERLFKGQLRVSSPAGNFLAMATGTRLHEVNNRLMRRIRRQIENWKAARFGRDAGSVPAGARRHGGGDDHDSSLSA
jgi:hypothetical protein